MKKIFTPLFAAGLMMITWQTSFADSLVLDVNGLINAPNNPQALANSNPDTELDWAKLLTGDSTLTFLEKIEFESDNPNTTFIEQKDLTSLDNYIGTTLSYGWKYALVKYGRVSALYSDSDGDGLLSGSAADIGATTGNGISHVSFFGSPTTPVPEPATMLLFGTGIAGLAGIARRKRD